MFDFFPVHVVYENQQLLANITKANHIFDNRNKPMSDLYMLYFYTIYC